MRTPHFILLVAICNAAWAHQDILTYDRISLSADASTEVDQDELRASLYAMDENENAQQSSNTVSQRIRQALAVLAKHPEIKSQTGSFSTHPVYVKRQITGWRSRQSITLRSQNASKLSELLGELQQYLQVEQIFYGVSDKQQNETEDHLIRQAIDYFNQRANIITKQMGRLKYRIVNMNIATPHSGAIHQQRSYARAEVMADAVAAPPVKTGTQRIQVTITGSIELKPSN